MSHLAQMLPGNTLIYPNTCQILRVYVELKIMFEAHKNPTWGFFLHFPHILLCNLEMVSGESPAVLDITFICNFVMENLKSVARDL